MNRLRSCVVIASVIFVANRGAHAEATPKPKAGAKRRSDPGPTCVRNVPPAFCPSLKKEKVKCGAGLKNTGLGYNQGPYLEGDGLEGRHFALASGSGSPFPPSKGMMLRDAATCDDPPLEIEVAYCESGTTAFACQVKVNKAPKDFSLCGFTDNNAIRGVAIVQGYWDEKGAWQGNNSFVTLSCNALGSPREGQSLVADGSISRCIGDYRFEPADKNEKLTACIRMERADYCGTGEAHTIAGTNVDIHTKENKVKRDECSDGRCFEASWSENGAECVGHSRWLGDKLDFDGTPCAKDFKPTSDGYRCRTKFSEDQIITRSRVNKCGSDPASCAAADNCPGCPKNTAKTAPAPSAPKK